MRITGLTPDLWPEFRAFLARAELPSLAVVEQEGPADSQRFFCAVAEGRIVGCTSLVPGCDRVFLDRGGARTELPCTYLCSTEVLPEYRGQGAGSALYAHRIAACPESDLALEIRGTGTPYSVHRQARKGLMWHTSRGFRVVGRSRDPDGGPVLWRPRRPPLPEPSRRGRPPSAHGPDLRAP